MRNPDDLNNIWYCQECDARFSFVSDIEDHKERTGHKRVRKVSVKDRFNLPA